MKILRTEVFKEDYKRLPKSTQEKFDSKFNLFITIVPTLNFENMITHLK